MHSRRIGARTVPVGRAHSRRRPRHGHDARRRLPAAHSGSAPPAGAEPRRLNPVASRAHVPALPLRGCWGPAAEAAPGGGNGDEGQSRLASSAGGAPSSRRSVLLRVVRQRAAVAPASTVGGREPAATWSTRRDSINCGILRTARDRRASVAARLLDHTPPRAPHQPWRALCVLSRRDGRLPAPGMLRATWRAGSAGSLA